jgi:thioesterase domain-containing protein/acyl carrier protein
LTGGDRLHQLPSRSERFRLINNYGPTECTVVVTSGELPNPSPVLHIGRPIANMQVYILDAHRQPVPIGVAGEIYVGGAGVARGYLNRPELTAERFLGDPFSSHSGARMYRSGDLARWRYDGTIQYIGRVDTQVKIRGLRIELGEIEAQLSQHPRIQDCAVIAQGQDSDKQLIAFYRARETQVDHLVEVSSEEFRAYLLRTLPNYMVPAAFVSVAAIPLNASGKVDRRALERMDVTLGSAHAYVAPRNVTQERLVAIFAEVLKRAPESIGLHDNFFEVGGHSLSAVQLIFRINHRFKRSLPLLAIFTHPHVAALAELLSGEESIFHDLVVPIQSGGDALPIFGIPGTGGIVPSLQPLSRALGKSQPFYALQAVGLDGTAAPLSSVEETALANIAAVKKVQPRGPYRFIGHSYGGVVAYEMARLLLEQGEEVASLTLLDSIAPSVLQERYEAGEVHAAKAKLNIADVEIDPERLLRSENGEDARYLDSLRSDSGVEIDRNQFAAFQEVCRANLSCYRTYKPSMLPREIDVALYRATQRDSQAAAMPDDYGWNRLLHRPIRVYDVDADHYSILRTVQLHEVGSPRLEFVS